MPPPRLPSLVTSFPRRCRLLMLPSAPRTVAVPLATSSIAPPPLPPPPPHFFPISGGSPTPGGRSRECTTHLSPSGMRSEKKNPRTDSSAMRHGMAWRLHGEAWMAQRADETGGAAHGGLELGGGVSVDEGRHNAPAYLVAWVNRSSADCRGREESPR